MENEEEKKKKVIREKKALEMAKIEKFVEVRKKIAEKRNEIKTKVFETMFSKEEKTFKISELPINKSFLVHGYKYFNKFDDMIPKFIFEKVESISEKDKSIDYWENKRTIYKVWGNKNLKKIAKDLERFFKEKNGVYWNLYIDNIEHGGLIIEIEPSIEFINYSGQKICWNPLKILSVPDEKNREYFQE